MFDSPRNLIFSGGYRSPKRASRMFAPLPKQPEMRDECISPVISSSVETKSELSTAGITVPSSSGISSPKSPSSPKESEKTLKVWAQMDRDKFDAYFASVGCSCHNHPPCGYCTHPGNPINQAECDDCWEARKESDFQIGDLVKCLPFEKWANGCRFFRDLTGESFRIVAIVVGGGMETCATLDTPYSEQKTWPLRAIRHAETEPRAEDGWIRRIDADDRDCYRWYHTKYGCIHHDHAMNHWYCPAYGYYQTWLALKAVIQKEMK